MVTNTKQKFRATYSHFEEPRSEKRLAPDEEIKATNTDAMHEKQYKRKHGPLLFVNL